jgi:myosin heavy subunit
LKEEKEKNVKFEELKNINSENIEKMNLQASQIGHYIETINGKDELIKNLKTQLNDNNTGNSDDQKQKLMREMNELKEENKKLKDENKNMKQSGVFLLQSTNPQLINNASLNELNEYKDKYKELQDEVFLLRSQNEELVKKSTMAMPLTNSVNILYEEENKRKDLEIEKLQKEINNLKNENILINNKKNGKESLKFLSQSIDEEEYNNIDLANNARERNESEDKKIDFPGLDDIKEKYNDCIKKKEELKELIGYIIRYSQCDDPDLQQKAKRACELLEIDY